jgi:hypothetical protein
MKTSIKKIIVEDFEIIKKLRLEVGNESNNNLIKSKLDAILKNFDSRYSAGR